MQSCRPFLPSVGLFFPQFRSNSITPSLSILSHNNNKRDPLPDNFLLLKVKDNKKYDQTLIKKIAQSYNGEDS
jgi:hypothetical protein